MITRRAFLSTVSALAAAHSGLARGLPSSPGPAYLSARLDTAEQPFVSAFDASGQPVFDIPLRHRGHAFAIHPRRAEIVAPARRPGRVLHVVDSALGRVSAEIASPQGRHFCGHATFSMDGRLLFATETDYVAARGVIGVYDADREYVRVAEYQSHGLDPHDIRVLSDGALVVANGGILTHPDAPGANLNLGEMDPSLVYLDGEDGHLLEQVRLPPALHQLSIRHLAIGIGGTVCVAMQYEGASEDRVPLVATHVRGGPLDLVDIPGDVLAHMRNYCGSATVDADRTLLAVSCPKGNCSVFFDLRHRRWLTAVEMPDGCGVAAAGVPGRFVLSSGLGGAARFDAHTGVLDSLHGSFVGRSRWDNHLVRLTEPGLGPARTS